MKLKKWSLKLDNIIDFTPLKLIFLCYFRALSLIFAKRKLHRESLVFGISEKIDQLNILKGQFESANFLQKTSKIQAKINSLFSLCIKFYLMTIIDISSEQLVKIQLQRSLKFVHSKKRDSPDLNFKNCLLCLLKWHF